jgi:hypothetical protein
MDRDQLLKSRATYLGRLDVRLRDDPDWTAFRAIDIVLNNDALQDDLPNPPTRRRRSSTGENGSLAYADLALRCTKEKGFPASTSEIVEFVGRHKTLPEDPHKAKLNIGSALSRDKRLRSISWQGGRAWWRADQPVPEHLMAAE